MKVTPTIVWFDFNFEIEFSAKCDSKNDIQTIPGSNLKKKKIPEVFPDEIWKFCKLDCVIVIENFKIWFSNSCVLPDKMSFKCTYLSKIAETDMCVILKLFYEHFRCIYLPTLNSWDWPTIFKIGNNNFSLIVCDSRHFWNFWAYFFFQIWSLLRVTFNVKFHVYRFIFRFKVCVYFLLKHIFFWSP